jgi:hypothetical protein
MINKNRVVLLPITLLLALFMTQVALAHDGPQMADVRYGGDSLFPWVVIFLSFIFTGLTALWMFRSGR